MYSLPSKIIMFDDHLRPTCLRIIPTTLRSHYEICGKKPTLPYRIETSRPGLTLYDSGVIEIFNRTTFLCEKCVRTSDILMTDDEYLMSQIIIGVQRET